MRSLFTFLCIALAAARAEAAEIAVALTDDHVDVDVGFNGAEITLFGAVTGQDHPIEELDIVAVLKGPYGDFNVRRVEQQGIIWLPGAANRIVNVPRFYASAANRPIAEITSPEEQARLQLGADNIAAFDTGNDDAPENEIHAAFLTELQASGHYADNVGSVSFLKGALFTITSSLPANTPVGEYSINIYLFRDGALLSEDTAALRVNKVGLERSIFGLAHELPLLYGLICVAISLLAGWLAGVAFRKS